DPARRTPVAWLIMYFRVAMYGSMCYSCRNGKPVPSRLDLSVVRLLTRMRWSLRNAPRPREAVKRSLRVGSEMTACVMTSRFWSAIDHAYGGNLCRQLVAP